MAKQVRGTCALCGYEGTKASLTKHLPECSKQHPEPKAKAEPVFHLRIQAEGTNLYWLDVEVKQKASLLKLDDFLRQIWLECCGHMSMFMIDNEHYMVPSPFDDEGFDLGEKSMDIRMDKVLHTGMTFGHEYDFGSTTALEIKVVNQGEGRFKQPLRLLSRNNPQAWQCHQCAKPATWVNSQDIYDVENPFYCDEHMKKHPDNDYAFLPVVNSPRMGVCGYTGSLDE
jgi:endogenous inhibitor of DNA gyrase (YacG/DUF329 family)